MGPLSLLVVLVVAVTGVTLVRGCVTVMAAMALAVASVMILTTATRVATTIIITFFREDGGKGLRIPGRRQCRRAGQKSQGRMEGCQEEVARE